MALLVPNEGEGLMLENIVNKTAPQALIIQLYKNNYTPVETSAYADFTAADFTGYSDTGPVTLTGASWTVTPGAPTYAGYAQQTWTSSAGSQSQPVYGYYIYTTTSTKCMWAELFTDGPYTIVNNGDAIKVTPYIELA